MRLLGKTLSRLLVAGMLLALPRLALASWQEGSQSSDDHWLYGIVDGMSDEAIENLLFSMYIGGCFGSDY